MNIAAAVVTGAGVMNSHTLRWTGATNRFAIAIYVTTIPGLIPAITPWFIRLIT